jgi:hypothetical protein
MTSKNETTNSPIHEFKVLHKTFSCRLVRYFGTLFWDDITLFWDDITLFWDENLLLFTFLNGKLRRNLFLTNKKFVYLLS